MFYSRLGKSKLITVRYNSVILIFEILEQAMAWAKELGEFVTIQFEGMEVVGKFGADCIEGGKLSNETAYTWKKRRRT